MASKRSACPHVREVGGNSWDDIYRIKNGHPGCKICESSGPNLWLCMHAQCLFIGCGESSADHSSDHSHERQHSLLLNLTTMRIWCYLCEIEVFKDANDPAFIMPIEEIKSAESSQSDGSPTRGSPSYSFNEESESDEDDDGLVKPRGLTGLQNLGNTCYMNGALQALSNCPPLTRFFLDCSGFVRTDKKPMLSRSYLRLVTEMWHKKRPSYIVPSSVFHGIRIVHPMFRGYTQQDTQEFLRCFMDQLHEELKTPISVEDPNDSGETSTNTGGVSYEEKTSIVDRRVSVENGNQSDTEYETCDSGLNSDRSSVENSISSDDGFDNLAGQPQVRNEASSNESITALSKDNQDEMKNSTSAESCLGDSVRSSNSDLPLNSKEQKDHANMAKISSVHIEYSDAMSELDSLQNSTKEIKTTPRKMIEENALPISTAMPHAGQSGSAVVPMTVSSYTAPSATKKKKVPTATLR